MITSTTRPLNDGERAELSSRLENAGRESRGALVKTGGVSTLVCVVLLALTLLASDAPWWIVTAFWLVLAAVFTLWIGMPWRRLMRQQVVSFEAALRANTARVTRVQSDRVIEFEEEEDEGACYAFALSDGTTVFICGQEFSGEERFPNSDFSLIDVLGPESNPITTLLEKNGRELTPERVIPASTKRQLAIPDHLTVVSEPLDTIEDALRS